MKLFYSQKGFTLVELAIVMIVIGLLIGGILKGQELVSNAKMTRTYANIESYKAAIGIFKNKYKALPGDMRDPSERLPNCDALASCSDTGGNADGIVGNFGVTNWSHDNQSNIASEPTQLWVHLSLANMITGISSNNNQAWGDLYPAAVAGGGFQVFHGAEVGINQASGHYLILRLLPVGDPHPTNPGDAVLSPAQLSYLDRKFDDNVPNAGTIIADDMNGCWNNATNEYDYDSNDKICISAYHFF